MPGWVGPVVALSLAVIALVYLGAAIGMALVARRAARELAAMQHTVSELRQQIEPTLKSIGQVARTAQEMSGEVREEVEALLESSREVRYGVKRGVRRVRRRLEEMDALYEVVHDEIQDTALDVAATIRSVRLGTGALGRIRRLLVRGRR